MTTWCRLTAHLGFAAVAGCAAINPAAVPPGTVFATFVNRTAADLCALHLGDGAWQSRNLIEVALVPGHTMTTAISSGSYRMIAVDCGHRVVADVVVRIDAASLRQEISDPCDTSSR